MAGMWGKTSPHGEVAWVAVSRSSLEAISKKEKEKIKQPDDTHWSKPTRCWASGHKSTFPSQIPLSPAPDGRSPPAMGKSDGDGNKFGAVHLVTCDSPARAGTRRQMCCSGTWRGPTVQGGAAELGMTWLRIMEKEGKSHWNLSSILYYC